MQKNNIFTNFLYISILTILIVPLQKMAAPGDQESNNENSFLHLTRMINTIVYILFSIFKDFYHLLFKQYV